MSVNDDPAYATRAGPARVEIYDTTLRDGASSRASRSPSTTSCASPSSSTGSASTTSRRAGPAPTRRTTSSSAARRRSCSSTRRTLVAFGSTRRVKGKVDSDDTLRHLVEAGTSTVCIVGKSWDYHVLEALDTTLDEGVAMVADSVEFLHADGRDVLLDAEHFFDGYRRNPEFAMRVLEGAVQAGATRLVLCDTNGGTLPDEVERIVREVVDYFGDDVGVGVHLHDDAGTRRGQRARRRARRRDAGAGHDQRLRRAHRQLQPHHDHPEPHAEDGDRDDPARPPRAAHAGRAPRRRAGEHGAQPAGAVRRLVGVRAQGRSARERDRQAPRRVRARAARLGRQRHPLRGVGAGGQVARSR